MLAALVLVPLTTTALRGTVPAAAEPLNDCVSDDNGVPVVQAMELSPSTVDVTDAPAEVTLRLQVLDHGGPGEPSGIASVTAWVESYRDFPRVELSPVGGEWWSGTFTVPQHTPDGAWRLWSLRISDAAGNGLPESVSGAVHDQDPPFDHTLQVTSSTPDTTAPTVTGIEVGRGAVDTTRRARAVAIDVTASDDLAGVEQVALLAARGPYAERAVLTPDDRGRLSGRLRIPRWRGNGTWHVILRVQDRAGNQRSYGTGELAALGRASFRVVSGKDTGQPVLTSFAWQPRTIDIRRHADTVRFVVRATDRRSGVVGVRVDLTGVREARGEGEGVRTIALRRTGGSARHGTWTGRVRLEPCTVAHGRSRLAVTLQDRAGREALVIPGRVLRLRTPDLFEPRATVEQPIVGASGPLTITFDEPVNGVDARNAPVSTSGGAVLDGTWRCRTSGGRATSCGTGRVGTAAWTPDVPLAIPGSYRVELDPEGVLGLTDLSGNPLRRVTCAFRTQADPPPSGQVPVGCFLPDEDE